jgi:hypothetical protein
MSKLLNLRSKVVYAARFGLFIIVGHFKDEQWMKLRL